MPVPQRPQVYLGEQYVNNPMLSDVTFLVEGRQFYAHRIALLASSDTFRAMFDGNYIEKDASSIPIPNIRYTVFHAMMLCIYTGEGLSRSLVYFLSHLVLHVTLCVILILRWLPVPFSNHMLHVHPATFWQKALRREPAL